MVVRLFTENKNYSGVCKMVSGYFDGFTVIKAEGYWQGNAEHSLIIEIDIPAPKKPKDLVDVSLSNIEHIVYAIKQLNKQDKILIQYIKAESKLL